MHDIVFATIMKRSVQKRQGFVVLLAASLLINQNLALPAEDFNVTGVVEDSTKSNNWHITNRSVTWSNPPLKLSNNTSLSATSGTGNDYLDKLDNLERSVAAVLIKVAYGTTSTTKRSIPDSSYSLGLTTVATPLLTTQRYQSPIHQHSSNSRNRNYELDLERDHALPTSAPNADILKSNNNPTYPNPNRHFGSHERDRHRHYYNSTQTPSIANVHRKTNSQLPTIPMYSGEIPLYSPPSRSFFTPPLPPEYQNPFADKPTLRGTNNDGGPITNTGNYINRRPIPPPSLMPGHERIPIRPPDIASSIWNTEANISFSTAIESKKPNMSISEIDRKKALNTPSRINNASSGEGDPNHKFEQESNYKYHENPAESNSDTDKRQEVLPNIRRILGGSNGSKGDIPAVLLKQVTQRPMETFRHLPSPIIFTKGSGNQSIANNSTAASPNINQSKQVPSDKDLIEQSQETNKTKSAIFHELSEDNQAQTSVTTPSAAAAIGEASATISSYATTSKSHVKYFPTFSSSSNTRSSGESAAAASSSHTTWTWAWNIHIYLSVVLFTILSVYSLYKMITYNKLTHLFSQSYFVCIHIILITICTSRIFYLCFDAYNIHSSFHILISELLLNLPATFLTISFSVLILFLFLKSLNHKNNRYSALIRPLTVVVGCGVHVVLCITLHYVESYTLQNHHVYFQQQQQQQYYRRQLQQQSQPLNYPQASISSTTSLANPPPPHRVLTLICQIIYIFICLSLGILYLYLYRILKRILHSKSQNYIHGYQNLSYAIHITIATALLFVLLAALQIFGAIWISTTRSFMTQPNIEVDWLQWGYQFSLRLIEIAIITLISWVTGLKTSANNTANPVNGESRSGMGATTGSGIYGSGINGINSDREKHSTQHNHSNVANFFLPCTSSSSQEQFETDYPAICNANTNLHTYTMRTGKLIYDDSYALKTLNSSGSPIEHSDSSNRGRSCTEYQLQEPMYQRPYDTGSIRSPVNQSTECGAQNQPYHLRTRDKVPYSEYTTDITTDHYENPNFDLQDGSSGIQGIGTNQKCKNLINPLPNLNSAGSEMSQHKMLLLQSDSCYSEPLQENSSYEFSNFERPRFKEDSSQTLQSNDECWIEKNKQSKIRDKKQKHSVDRGRYENPERRSTNSTNSNLSSNCGSRFTNFNPYEHDYYNGVRKSGTLNNIVITSTGGHSRGMIAGTTTATKGQRNSGAQTLALSERPQFFRKNCRVNTKGIADINNLTICHGHSIKRPQYHHNSEEEEDDMIIDSNVECKNLIQNGSGSCITNEVDSSTPVNDIKPDQCFGVNVTFENEGRRFQTNMNKHSQDPHLHIQSKPKLIQLRFAQNHPETSTQSSELSAGSSASSNSGSNSSASDSMLVAEQGFLRFRALDDMDNIQSIAQACSSVDSTSVCLSNSSVPTSPQNCSVTGIDC